LKSKLLCSYAVVKVCKLKDANMDTTLQSAPPLLKDVEEEKPVILKTRKEVSEYLAKHLKPVDFGPKGQPIYAMADLENLNVVFPEDI
jgi:hypothetical protein